MQLKDPISFEGGLNLDDDPRMLPKGDYVKMKNARTGSPDQQQDEGLSVSVKEATYIAKYPARLPADTTHLGKAIDVENQRAYIMLYTTSDEFIIHEFDPTAGTYGVILEVTASDWGITDSIRFINPRVVNGNLILTDNVNPIRMVNIERGRNSFNTGVGYSTGEKPSMWDVATAYSTDDYVFYVDRFYKARQATTGDIPPDNPADWEDLCAVEEAYASTDPEVFLFEAAPPLIAATPSYQSDTSVLTNNLRGSVYQFSYRYVYMDFRRSTYAPPSAIPAPDGEETSSGIMNKDVSLNNSIKITLSAPGPDVRAIEVIGRSSEDPASWFEIENVDIVNENGDRGVDYDLTLDVFWYNTRVKRPVDQAEVYKLFTYVPVRAQSVEIIEGNRVVFANITEGYAGVRPIVSATLSYTNLTTATTSYPMSSGPSVKSTSGDDVTWVLLFTLPYTGEVGATYRITIHPSGGSELQAEYTMVAGDAATYPTSVKTALQSAMTTAGMEVATCAAGASDHSICAYERTVHYTSFPYTGWSYSGLVLSPSYLNKYAHLKFGATHKFAQVYRDRGGRMCQVVRDNNFDISIPFYTENTNANMNTVPVVDLYLTHKPPSWADSYEILYARSNIRNPLQLKATGWAVDGNYWKFQIQQTQDDMYANRSGWKVSQYQWEEGDRVRFIGLSDGVDTVSEEDGVLIDLEITKAEDDSGTEYLFVQAPSDISMPANTALYIVEIYKPVKELSETVYYTTGMTFSIDQDGNGYDYHKGDTDQVLNISGEVITPARVRITAHDVWKFRRVNYDNGPTNTFTFWAESAYPSDWHSTSYMTSQGLPVPEIEGYGQATLDKRLRRGGILIPDSKLNYIATFDYDDFEDMQEQYGPISGIREVGFVLKVIQHHKVSSIYIGRLEVHNAEGGSELVTTDDVFGTVRPSQEDYGCQDPESIEAHDRHLYFWDLKYGVIIRDSPNGMKPISDKSMKRYFLDKAHSIEASPTTQVIMGYNPKADELWVSFRILGSQAETMIFSERRLRWVWEADNYVEEYFTLGRKFYVEYSVFTYEYDSEDATGYLKWGHLVNDSEVDIRVISNIEQMKQKIFNALAVYANQEPECDQVLIPVEAGDDEKETELHPANWNEREGIWYGQILRDRNTPGDFGPADMDRMLNGRPMRGEYAQFRLKWSSTTEQLKLYRAMVLSTPSERSR